MNFGALIIGDEILSGRREDKHLPQLIRFLAARGLRLSWARYVGDDRSLLAEVLKQTRATGDVVFSFGGIGATPDDHTRQSAAQAFETELMLHPDAEREIRTRFGGETTAMRLAMGIFPAGSRIIPNPYNRIPGFEMHQHYFVPGFPEMAWPMVEWVLDTHFADQHFQLDFIEQAVTVWDAFEGQLMVLMENLTRDFPGATLFSLPALENATQRCSIELGLKGPKAEVEVAMRALKAGVTEAGFLWEDKS